MREMWRTASCCHPSEHATVRCVRDMLWTHGRRAPDRGVFRILGLRLILEITRDYPRSSEGTREYPKVGLRLVLARPLGGRSVLQRIAATSLAPKARSHEITRHEITRDHTRLPAHLARPQGREAGRGGASVTSALRWPPIPFPPRPSGATLRRAPSGCRRPSAAPSPPPSPARPPPAGKAVARPSLRPKPRRSCCCCTPAQWGRRRRRRKPSAAEEAEAAWRLLARRSRRRTSSRHRTGERRV